MVEILMCYCGSCKKEWNFYQEKADQSDNLSSVVQIQGMYCPQCGRIGSSIPPNAEAKPFQTEPFPFESSETTVIEGKMPEGVIIHSSSTVPFPGTALIKINPEADAVFLEMKKEADRLLEWGMVRVIDTDWAEKSAGEDLGACATLLKKLTAEQKVWTTPIKTNLELVSGAFNDVIKPLQEIEKQLKEKVLAYRAEMRRQASILEEANRISMENSRKEAAAHNGEISAPVVVNPVPAAPAKHIYTGTGSLGETENWDFKIVNFDLLPEKYKIHSADVVKIRKDVVKNKGTLVIPGVEQFKKEGLRITTR